MIVSGIGKLSAGAYMCELFPRFLRRRWYWLALPVAPFAVLSFVNVNFVYVALMALFLVVPTLLGYAYFYYALGEECVASIRRSRVEFSEAGLGRRFFDDDGNQTGFRQYAWSDFSHYVATDKSILIFLKGSGLAFQLVPTALFAEGEAAAAVALLDANLAGENRLTDSSI